MRWRRQDDACRSFLNTDRMSDFVTKRIYFVADDSPETESLMQGLSSRFSDLQIRSTPNFAKISSLAEIDRPDALFVTTCGKGASGSVVLEEARRLCPGSIRYQLEREATDSDSDGGVKSAMGANIVIPHPWDEDVIAQAIQRQLDFDFLVPSRKMRDVIGGLRTFPSIPSVYQDVINELNSSIASPESVAKIISADMAITTKLIQVVNSAYYGLQQRISDPVQAVFHLGLDSVKSLVLGINSFTRFDKIRPYYYSIDRVWKHSLKVASLAKLVARTEGLEQSEVDDAYTAGLLHDIGKLALAVNFSEEYHEVMETAKREDCPVHEIEKRILGVTHGELGGFLLYLWGLPLSVVEAVALHHCPSLILEKSDARLSPLTAVHIAECLNKSSTNSEFPENELALDRKYLEALGVE